MFLAPTLGKPEVLGPRGPMRRLREGPAGGRNFRPDFFNFLFPPKLLEMGPQGPGGPWGLYFVCFPHIFGPPGNPLGDPGGVPGAPYFPYLGLLPIGKLLINRRGGALVLGVCLTFGCLPGSWISA